MEVEFIQACPTTTLLIMSTVMSAVGTAAQYAGQRETAKKKETYQRHLAELQKNAAHLKSAALISKNIQTGEAVARKKHEVSKAGAKASAQGRLSAISGGVAGLSIETLLTEYESQEGAYIYALEEEQRLRDKELDRTLEDVALGAEQQMFATQRPVNYPSALGAIMQFGASALKTKADYQMWKDGATDTTTS